MSKYSNWRTSSKSPSSRGGKREDLGGLYVRSAWEANWARYLNFLMKHGKIERWEYEPDTFMFDGIQKGTRSYTPDFKVYQTDGSVVYHEVKGYMDSTSKTRMKRMAKYHPDVKIELIDGEVYRSIAKSVKALIQNWE